MGSLDFQLWTRIKAMNRTAFGTPHSCGSIPSGRYGSEEFQRIWLLNVAAA
jgi:hypothetical protein